MNNHLEIAGFLLARGADINTNWSSHEPASILHELVWHKNHQAMQFLIERGKVGIARGGYVQHIRAHAC